MGDILRRLQWLHLQTTCRQWRQNPETGCLTIAPATIAAMPCMSDNWGGGQKLLLR